MRSFEKERGKAGFSSRSNNFPFLRGQKGKSENPAELMQVTHYFILYCLARETGKSVKSVYVALPGIPCGRDLGCRDSEMDFC